MVAGAVLGLVSNFLKSLLKDLGHSPKKMSLLLDDENVFSDVFMCLKKHWMAVFSTNSNRIYEELVETGLQYLKTTRMSSITSSGRLTSVDCCRIAVADIYAFVFICIDQSLFLIVWFRLST